MDEHGNEVLNLGSFALLPQHVVRLILTREELKADEFSKFQARKSCYWLHLKKMNKESPRKKSLGCPDVEQEVLRLHQQQLK